MQTNTCDSSDLDSDALLPPHKRLLAGLKKQIPDFPCEYEIRRNNLLRSHLSNPNISNKEIVEASKCAALKATETAGAKRAHAEQKAAKAAKAVAAAKCALELVATLEEEAARQDNKFQKRNKTKKHVPVQALYGNKGGNRNTNSGEDEEMARDLHRSINSLPRISKTSPGPDVSKGHKRKKVKASASSSSEVNGNMYNGNGVKGVDTSTVDSDPSGHDKVILGHGDGRAGMVVEVPFDCLGKKRGRVKQKKLPLSVCSFKDQTSPKGEAAANGLMPPVERTSTWKCNEFRAPACVSQNKVMQS